ncbi:helix-turn-helix domain-containing protein [Streptomyces adustus]|uniref:helix-turn-helix domain-containing protein n=1 Tax=Streptomyces adustus TaxID=1609272 RepID=UPI0035E2D634
MPRWRALPDELDPQVSEFVSQLRRLVDRGGLSIAAVADRTGYSKTSWERYLNGRLLAPKGAVVALAEVAGTSPVHLTTMWELAERAWSRSEMRHDMTMEAFRISQARAALGEFGAPPVGTEPPGKARPGRAARQGGSATVTPGIAGPAGVAPTVPQQSGRPDVDVRQRGQAVRRGSGPGPGSGPEPSPSPYGARPRGDGPGGGGPAGDSAGSPGKRRATMFLSGLVGVLVVMAGVFYFATDGGDGNGKAGTSGSPSAPVDTTVALPAGVKCSGAGCTGKDAERMGCSGALVTTAARATVATTVVEVRYSATCKAAWGRITGAARGDEVRVTVGTARRSGTITAAGDTIAYTPMLAVKDAGEATACATLASGAKGCTR